MAAVCDICAKKPGFGNNRPWSRKITKRRFNPNIQRVRATVNGCAQAAQRVHRLPQGRQGLPLTDLTTSSRRRIRTTGCAVSLVLPGLGASGDQCEVGPAAAVRRTPRRRP